MVIRAFQDGSTPETIAQRYPTVTLTDTYAVIAYYRRHRDELETYLEVREQEAGAVRRRIEANQGNLAGVGERRTGQQNECDQKIALHRFSPRRDLEWTCALSGTQ